MASRSPYSSGEVQTPVTVEHAVPRVTLRNSFAHPYDSAIAAARTCYAPRLISPEEITEKQRTTIGAATFYAGHHTVYQHAHFEFGLENVSRQFVWSILHAHPFYNSEQQSQRYVRLDRALAYIPPFGDHFSPSEREIFGQAVARAWSAYRTLTVLLKDDARRILADIWNIGAISHPRRIEKVERQAEKRAIEVARYVLPVAAATTMVHTLSGVVLHRLWRMQQAGDTPTEARAIIGQMVARVREVDSQFFDRFDGGPLEDLPEWHEAPSPGGQLQALEFDARLGARTSLLVDYSPAAPRVMAQAYRAVLGLSETECSDAQALDRMLNPAHNP
jgi:thymidylate synthase ThyX